MRKAKFIIPLLLMLFVSIGNVWGDTYTITFGNSANSATGLTNGIDSSKCRNFCRKGLRHDLTFYR